VCLDQIAKLNDQIKELTNETLNFKAMLSEDEADNRRLKRQVEKLQYAENALVSLNGSLVNKEHECTDLTYQLKNMLEQLCHSEHSIKRFLKSLKDQDDIHDGHIILFRQSENLMKKFYEEKLSYCLNQIALRETKTASIEIQTEDVFDEHLKQQYENQIQKLDIELGMYLYILIFISLDNEFTRFI
jgi:hypothetical protein